ncbi:hypothetical protein [Streptomyces sp. 5-6(2022)]|uniref:hypothetical protein n=1 Tax=Streptomyces sp. 5-6(2022) TaxID=2936510 RepID=UPI0023B90E97|nr:hypothetical protein [Streptomyces sp. 5-6(2022)]
MRKLTDKQRSALMAAVDKWDRSLTGVDMRTVRGLISRGLVDVTTSKISYHRGNGVWVSRTVVSDVKINDAGRAALLNKVS